MKTVFAALTRNRADFPSVPAFCQGQDRLDWATLAGRVYAGARALSGAPQVIAVALPNGLDYVVADLAVTLAGRRLVPIPHFFSAEQIAHILRDAGVQAVIGRDLGLPVLTLPDGTAAPLPYGGGATRVIYTSGSSGTPKGVVLGDRQIGASLAGLRAAFAPDRTDIHLSILPQSQLLEQICGILLPILAGAQVVIAPEATPALFGGPIAPMVAAFDAVQPTTSLIAPRLLAAWVADLAARGANPPASLRYVAIGGAPTAPALLHRALALGIPVHEGYGLSEACSVVAVNRPGDNHPGSVGRVLDGITVTIDAGEIVVSGPTVMQGYLGHEAAPTLWRTGDLGHFIGDRLVIEGRRDNLIVTPAGRNISPEWVEARLVGLAQVMAGALVLEGDALVLVLAAVAPVTAGEIAARLADLPPYARPSHLLVVDPRTPGLIRPAGTPNRAIARALVAAARGQWIALAPAAVEMSQ